MASLTPTLLPRPQRAEQLAAQIATTLRTAIVNATWPPGSRLPTENELARHFGVSRPVIREAMTVLKHEGLVQSRQGAGAFVADAGTLRVETASAEVPSEDAVLEILELRRAIEVEAAALAAVRRTPEDLRRIRDARDALNRKIATGADSVEEGFNFHRSIVNAARNAQLVRLLDQIKPLLVGTMRVMRENRPRQKAYTKAVQREHDDVLNAIAKGDAQLARHAALAHFEASESRIRATDASVWSGIPVHLDKLPRQRSRVRARG